MFGLILNPSFTYTETASPSPGYTGAPGESTCGASGCHVGNAENLDPNKLTISNTTVPSLSNGYSPGTTYNITIGMGTVQSNKKGFQFTALDANGNGAGTLTIIDINKTSKTTQGNREYIGHKNANSTSAWIFKWQAPSVDLGPVTFYASGVGSNEDTLATGDIVYKSRAVVSTSSGLTQINLTGIKPVKAEAAGINIFPNPFRNKINIDYSVKNENVVRIGLFDLEGKQIAQLFENNELPGRYFRSFDITEAIPSGIYLLSITEGEQVYYKKLIAE